MELVLSILIGALVGAGVLYVIIKPKLKATQELDEATKLQNEELHAELVALEKQHAALTARRQEIQDSILYWKNKQRSHLMLFIKRVGNSPMKK